MALTARRKAPVPGGKAPHHPQIQPDDLPAPHPDVARMGVGVEERVVENLLDVVLRQLDPDFLHVVPVLLQAFPSSRE